MSMRDIMKDGLWNQNIVFSQLLGMCPTMAVTTSGTNGLGMGLATTAVLICSNIIISLIKGIVPSSIRIPIYIVVIAAFVSVVDMVMAAYLPARRAAMVAPVAATTRSRVRAKPLTLCLGKP